MYLLDGEQLHCYSLHADKAGGEEAGKVELEAYNPSAAMRIAQKTFPDREVRIFEDGNSLGRMMCTRTGYWILRP